LYTVCQLSCDFLGVPRETKSVATKNVTSASTEITTETNPTTIAPSSSPTTEGDVTMETDKPTEVVDSTAGVNSSHGSNASLEKLITPGEMVSII